MNKIENIIKSFKILTYLKDTKNHKLVFISKRNFTNISQKIGKESKF